MTDILLINPPNSLYSGLPLGLAYIAAYLDKAGYNVRCLDAAAEGLTIQDTLKRIAGSKSSLIGLSVLSANTTSAYELAKKVKALDVKTIMGGIHPTAFPTEPLNNGADFVIIGEGEVTIAELLDALYRGGNFEDIRGLAYKKDGKIKISESRPPIQDLDSLPFPARYMFPLERYPRIERGPPGGEMITSRGCPYNCIFCSSHLVHGKCFRARSPKNVLEEIQEIVNKYKIRRVSFLDDIFTFNRDRVMQICDLIIENRIDIEWYCLSRVNHVDGELLKKMKESGCFLIEYGVESGSEKVLKRIKKGITLNQVREAFALTREAGIKIRGDFMIGNPSETKEDVEMTLKLAMELNPWRIAFSITTPLPGSELYEYAVKNDMLETTDFRQYDMMARSVWHSDVMSSEEIVRLQREMYRRYYLRPKILARQLLDLRSIYDAQALFNLMKSWLHIMRSDKKASGN